MSGLLINIQDNKIEKQISDQTQEEIMRGLKIALEPFGILMAMCSDRLTLWRISNLIKITDEAKTILEGKGLKAEAVEKKFLSRFIEEASHEDNPDLQQMWANLLASESECSGKSSYINILKEISAEDAKLLQKIYQKISSDYDEKLKWLYLKYSRDSFWGSETLDIKLLKESPHNYLLLTLLVGSELTQEDENFIKSFQKLESLHLIEVISYSGPINNPDGQGYVFYAKGNFLGQNFIEACLHKE